MAADFTFVAGKYWRILVILMIHTGMMGMVVITGSRDSDITPFGERQQAGEVQEKERLFRYRTRLYS